MTTDRSALDTAKLKKQIARKCDILERLLSSEGPVHPQHCNCVTKSRNRNHHLKDCPYRAFMEFLQSLKKCPMNHEPWNWGTFKVSAPGLLTFRLLGFGIFMCNEEVLGDAWERIQTKAFFVPILPGIHFAFIGPWN